MNGSGDLDRLFATLRFITEICDDAGIPYAVAGGMAVSVWARVRTTFDVDLVLGLPLNDADRIATKLNESGRFPFDPVVLPFGNKAVVRVHRLASGPAGKAVIVTDLLLFDPAFSASVNARRVRLPASDGREYWFCTAEDLIVMKLLAGRDLDERDIIEILDHRGESLDREYINK